MSVFDAPTKEQTETPTNDQVDQTKEDWVGLVVSEKGDQWNDPQALAKGYIHAQSRIKELEALAEEAKKNDYAKQLLEELQNQKQTPATVSGSGAEELKGKDSQAVTENTTLKPEEIDSLVNEAITKREKMSTAAQNIEAANAKITEVYGEKAAETVQAKAKELGLSMDKLKEIASESPSAFVQLMGVKDTNIKRPLSSAVNTSSNFNGSSGERNNSYYQRLRRENKKSYYDPQTQAQMFADMKRLGSDFNK